MIPAFQLTGLPMPPSSNHQYAARAFPGKHAKGFTGERKVGFTMARICPTRELEQYEKAMKETWKAEGNNLAAIYKCRAAVKDWQLRGLYLRVETFAFFPYFDLFTKEGLPRKMDGTNRLKALHDCLAEILEVDDCWFWDAEVKKRVDEKDRKFCMVRFSPVRSETLQQMKAKGEL